MTPHFLGSGCVGTRRGADETPEDP